MGLSPITPQCGIKGFSLANTGPRGASLQLSMVNQIRFHAVYTIAINV